MAEERLRTRVGIEAAKEYAEQSEQATAVRQFFLYWFKVHAGADPIKFTGLYAKLQYLGKKTWIPKPVMSWIQDIRIRVLQNKERPTEGDWVLLACLDAHWSGEEQVNWPEYSSERETDSIITERICVVVIQIAEGLVKVQITEGDMEGQEGVLNPIEIPELKLWEGAELVGYGARLDPETNEFQARYWVLEPGMLIDVTALAECYKIFGNRAVHFLLNRFQPFEPGLPILIGNIANVFLDEMVMGGTTDARSAIRKAFQLFPFSFVAAENLSDTETLDEFLRELHRQWDHINVLVSDTLQHKAFKIDRSRLLIEPSFICGSLGVQGRMDLFQAPEKGKGHGHIIELKSGKSPWPHENTSLVSQNHSAQAALYCHMAQRAYPGFQGKIQAYIFYSKYPQDHLRHVVATQRQLREMMDLRNQIISKEYAQAFENVEAKIPDWVHDYSPEYLSELAIPPKLRDMINQQWNQFTGLFYLADEIGLALFNTYTGFLGREWWFQRSQMVEEERVEKLISLRLSENHAAEDDPWISLEIPDDKLWSHPFRPGDLVLIYRSESSHPMDYQVFKGTLMAIDGHYIKVQLRHAQQKNMTWEQTGDYVMEADFADFALGPMYRGLYRVLGWDQRERNQYLGIEPWHIRHDEPSIQLKEGREFQPLWEKVQRASPYFLIQGPPGTGKTSRCIRALFEGYCLKSEEGKQAIAFMAFTNRAVDELCEMIKDFGCGDFVRLGSKHSMDPRWKDYSLDSQISGFSKREQVEAFIKTRKVWVGTVFAFMMKPEIFKMVPFELAILDEASQVLEPHLLPLITQRNGKGQAAIPKWICIGDPLQLPAVVTQAEGFRSQIPQVLKDVGIQRLDMSVFERWWWMLQKQSEGHAFMHRLEKQGRMHPEISAFIGKQYYQGELKEVEPALPHQKEYITNIWKGKPQIWPCLAEQRVVFVDVKPEISMSGGKVNKEEADVVAQILKQITELTEGQSIGVITPFRQQLSAIRDACLRNEVKLPEHFLADTVERFQGGQKDIVVVSLVVNNLWGAAQLSNPSWKGNVDRKLNVLLSRARKQLIVVGAASILKSNPFYAEWLKWMEEKGCMIKM